MRLLSKYSKFHYAQTGGQGIKFEDYEATVTDDNPLLDQLKKDSRIWNNICGEISTFPISPMHPHRDKVLKKQNSANIVRVERAEKNVLNVLSNLKKPDLESMLGTFVNKGYKIVNPAYKTKQEILDEVKLAINAGYTVDEQEGEEL